MDSLQAIKNRLKAVKNVGQITKAMEVVAATKMRRAQETALSSRPYAYEALQLLYRLLGNVPVPAALSLSRPIKNTLVLIVASDRGLAGSFNSQIVKCAERFFQADQQEGRQYLVATSGKKAEAYAHKLPFPLVRAFANAADLAEPAQTAEIGEFLVGGFLNGDWDRVITVSMHFRTALKQEALIRQLLPLSLEKIKQTIEEIVPEHGRYADLKRASPERPAAETDYLFEPSARELLDALLPHLTAMQIYHLMLEAKASEHSARRVAMKTASDNAAELSNELLLEYNKARQVGITRELSEITTTIMTLE